MADPPVTDLKLVDGAAHRLVAEHRDHPLDLAPAAEVDDIAEDPAAVGADRRLRHGVLAEAGDELGSVGQGFPAGEMDVVTQGFPLSFPRSVLAWISFQTAHNGRLTPDKMRRLCHGRGMSGGKFTQAGGFILAASILIGAVVGTVLRQSTIGLLAGFVVGVAIAVLIWLVDRRR